MTIDLMRLPRFARNDRRMILPPRYAPRNNKSARFLRRSIPRSNTEKLFFLTVLTVAKDLDGKFIGLKLAFFAYLF